MRQRNRLFTAIVGLVLAGAATVGIVAASSDSGGERATASGSGFKPKSLEGKWTGKWENKTFGSTGSIRANVKVGSPTFIPLVDFGGNVFGYQDPDSEKVTLKKGTGKNTWNSKGFNVSKKTEAFGDLDLTYKHSNNSFEGEGEKPPCNKDISWELDGELTSKKFSADVDIDLGGGQKAKTELSAKKK